MASVPANGTPALAVSAIKSCDRVIRVLMDLSLNELR
jgi:hypothetical protein